MTTPERGLFEHDAQSSRRFKENWDDAVKLLNGQGARIADLEQRLAEAEAKAKIVDAMKAYDEADADAEFEPPHPIFRLAEERDAFMFECVQLRARCGELEGLLAEQRKFIEIVYKGSKSGNRNYPIGHTNDERAERLLATPQPAQEQITK